MNKLKKIFVLVLIIAVASLGLTGCKKDKSEHPAGEHPSKEAAPGEHPSPNEHPSSEHPQ
jgi:hypothetical protein